MILEGKSAYAARLKALIRSTDPKHRALVKAVNEDICRVRDVQPGTVHTVSALSNMSVQYKNGEYIGTELMPILPVAKLSDKYYTYDKRSRLAVPNGKVGARARAAEVTDGRGSATYSCEDYAWENYIDKSTLKNQDAPLDEMMDLVDCVNDVAALAREIRIADIVTTSGNYGSNTTGAAAVWEDPAVGNPIKDIQGARAAVWSGAGAGKLVGFCSLDVWNAISRHDKVRGLFTGVKDGLMTTTMLAGYLGLADIKVSDARKDTTNEGAAASYTRLYGKVFGIVRVAKSPSVRNAAFGYSFQLKTDPVTTIWYDEGVGKEGGYSAKVGMSEDHKIVAADTSFLLTACIS